jgi:hypothetical protein
MFLLAALIIGTASAFTATTVNDHYILINGTYVLKSSLDGDCFAGRDICTYEIVDEPVAPVYTNPDNFMPIDSEREWVTFSK